MLHRHQGRGARRIDGVGGTHQVEPVRDPPDDDVRDEPGNGLRSERRQHPLQLAAQLLELLLGALGIQPAEQVQRLADDQAALDRHRVTAVQVCPLAEHDRRAGADLLRELGLPGVRERVARDLQRQPLVGLAAYGNGRDAMCQRVEPGQRAKISAALAVRAIRVGEVWVVVDVGVPGLRRGVRGRVELADDVSPIGIDVGRAGKKACHADDRDALHALVARNRRQDRAPASRFSAWVPTPTTSCSSASRRQSEP